MAHSDKWIVGCLVAAFGLGGLFLAAQAVDDVMYAMGILVFVGSVLFNFLQIKDAYDRKE